MNAAYSARLILLACASWGVGPVGVAGQASAVHVTYDRADLSTPDWGSMHGASASVTLGSLWLGMDLRLGYGRLSAGRPDVEQWCNFISCVDGPFHESLSLDVVRAGLGRSVVRGRVASLDLSLDLTFVRQARRLTHGMTAENFTAGDLTDFGLGPSATLRFSPAAFGLRPMVRAGYQRVFESACGADTTCYPSRNLLEFGVGLAWIGM
jgi:hypothetical protein